MRIAMIGTRGVPAAYGGFETAVEEIGSRLAKAGHEVTVYCRRNGSERPRSYAGMRLVYLPAIRSKAIETLSHTALSTLDAMFRRRYDAAFVFNAANAPFVPMLHARGIPVALHVDGLEWKRGKWGRWGRRYYRFAEQLAVRSSDALIADARGIADYYDHEFGVPTELLTYGTKVLTSVGHDALSAIDLQPGAYHLVVARFEPENHVDVIVEGYTRSAAKLPLVVVGSAPYAAAYTDKIAAVAAKDPRIRLLGGVWDQKLLDQLYANACSYLHGHSVGGTNPSLLRSMGAGTAVLAWDVVFNREVLGSDGRFFSDDSTAGRLIEDIEQGDQADVLGKRLQERAALTYNWDAVAEGYGHLAERIGAGYSTRGLKRGKRAAIPWSTTTPVPTEPVEA
jgi:glycosyltransferase involved in cell wall biosynthesis